MIGVGPMVGVGVAVAPMCVIVGSAVGCDGSTSPDCLGSSVPSCAICSDAHATTKTRNTRRTMAGVAPCLYLVRYKAYIASMPKSRMTQSGGPSRWLDCLAQKPEYRDRNANRRYNQTAEFQQ